jgi:lysine 6-dehydrogenase
MGSAIAYDLVQAKGKQCVEVVDADAHRARAVGEALGITHSSLDLRDDAAVAKLFKGANVVVSASDYSLNDTLTRQAIAAKACFCDLGGNNDVVARQLAQSDAAKAAGVTVIPDCGLAPGLAGLLAARGVELVKDPVKACLRVGGLPAHPKPPLNYSLVFSVRGLTNEYLEPSEVLRDGKLVKVPTMTDIEELTFPAPYGKLEAFHTSGGVSTLTKTLAGKLKDLDYKTIRYPGHAIIIKALIDLGFLSEEPVTVGGAKVSPRPTTEAIFTKSLSLGDDDVVLLRVTVESKTERLIYQLIDTKDSKTGHTAMARTTGYPTAVIALMMADGRIKERGVLPGEKLVPVDALIEELAKRGVRIETKKEHVA